MPSQWYFRLDTEELGPISYHELIDLVCKGTVREDDYVRREWPADWQRADSVVGLFYMARRRAAGLVADTASQPVVAAEQKVPPDVAAHSTWWKRCASLVPTFFHSAAEVDPAISIAEACHGSAEGTAWVVPAERNSLTLPRCNEKIATANDIVLSEEVIEPSAVSAADDEWDATVAAALRAAEARDAALAKKQTRDDERSRWRCAIAAVLAGIVRVVSRPVMFLFGWILQGGRATTRDHVASGLAALERWLPRPDLFRIGFKFGAAILTANLTAWGLMHWSDQQALRFPGSEPTTARAFPLIGEWDSSEFAFLVFQATLLAGIAGYGVAAFLEANTDD